MRFESAGYSYKKLRWLIGSTEREADLAILAFGLFEVQNLGAEFLFERRGIRQARGFLRRYFDEKDCDPGEMTLRIRADGNGKLRKVSTSLFFSSFDPIDLT